MHRHPVALGVAVADACGSRARRTRLQHDLLDQHVRDDGEVLSRQRGLEEGVVGRGPHAAPRRGLEQRGAAGRAAAVSAVVVAHGDARRFGGRDELLGGGRARRAHRHPQRTTHAVRLVVDHDTLWRLGGREVLALEEERQHVVVGPALAALSGPAVEVTGVTTHVRHVVEPGRAAQHLATRHHHAAVRQALAGPARIAGVHPVDLGVELQGGDGGRHQLTRRRGATGLDEGDAHRRVLAEAGGDDRARRATSDDDDVEAAVGSRR